MNRPFIIFRPACSWLLASRDRPHLDAESAREQNVIKHTLPTLKQKVTLLKFSTCYYGSEPLFDAILQAYCRN